MNPRIVFAAVLVLLVLAGAVSFLDGPDSEAPTPAALDSPATVSGPGDRVAPPLAPTPPAAAGTPRVDRSSGPAARPPDPLRGSPEAAAPARAEEAEEADADAVEDDDDARSDADPEDPEPRTIWSVDAQGIEAAVREAVPELKECYEEWLKLDPDIEGRVVFDLVIDVPLDGEAAEDGTPLASITDLGIADSTLEHPFMEGCALNVFSDLWFSPPEDGPVQVTYPIVLDRR
jgi:hypothetical protein